MHPTKTFKSQMSLQRYRTYWNLTGRFTKVKATAQWASTCDFPEYITRGQWGVEIPQDLHKVSEMNISTFQPPGPRKYVLACMVNYYSGETVQPWKHFTTFFLSQNSHSKQKWLAQMKCLGFWRLMKSMLVLVTCFSKAISQNLSLDVFKHYCCLDR